MDPEERLVNKFLSTNNIATQLDSDQLEKIGGDCYRGFEIDEESRAKWLERHNKIEKLAMQIAEPKNWPHDNASNIIYPLLSTAALQFSSRAFSSIVGDTQIVKAKVVGQDVEGEKADRAKRVSDHMSYQCATGMETWTEETDKLFTILPYTGCCFKRSYFDQNIKQNVSDYVSAKYVSFHYKTKKFEKCPRVTFIYELYPNEIEERIRSGFFLDKDLDIPSRTDEEDNTDQNDPLAPHVFLEQYTWIDLDGDGYKEPYTVTLHKESKQIVRIKARYDIEGIIDKKGKIVKIIPVEYLTQFVFMPRPDGSAYGFGFGHLLYPINKTINATVNQLLDAGTRANAQSGFIGKGVNLGRGRGGGNITLKLNEWKPVGFSGEDLRKNIFPLPIKEPSTVLFNLLGFMVSAGERVASVSELLTGDQTVHNEPATTTLARIEQGLKLFSNIYLRIYRALTSEFKKLYRLNRLFMEPEEYFIVLDDQRAIKQEDYNHEDLDITPTANPNEVSNTQKLVKAQLLMSLKGQGLNDDEINRRFLEAAQIDDIEKILPQEGAKPPVDPKITLELQKLELERSKFEFDMFKYELTMTETQSKIIKNLADAEAKEVGPQLQIYTEQMKALVAMRKGGEGGNNTGRVSGMANKQSNKGSV